MERIGQGTILAVSSDGGTVWSNIARLETIGELPRGEVDDIEITNHDSPGNFKEYVAGLGEAGELEFTGIWIADATQRATSGILGLLRDWRVTLPGGLGVWRCRGYLKSLSINPQREETIQFTGTLKLSGVPTLTW